MPIDHLAAIAKGEVTKANVIGIRKLLKAEDRRDRGYSVSRTAPKGDPYLILSALREAKPAVVGELHASGVQQLRSSRYAKRLAPVADIISDPGLRFQLIDFEDMGNGRLAYYVPIYRARCGHGSFDFYNIPWQSGGDGPQIERINA